MHDPLVTILLVLLGVSVIFFLFTVVIWLKQIMRKRNMKVDYNKLSAIYKRGRKTWQEKLK